MGYTAVGQVLSFMPRFACAAQIVVVKQNKKAATDVARKKVKQFGDKQFGGPSKVSISPNATSNFLPRFFSFSFLSSFFFFFFFTDGNLELSGQGVTPALFPACAPVILRRLFSK
jgi:hypothetical protein